MTTPDKTQTLEQPMTLEEENRRLKEILLRVLEGVKQNDASPDYEYSGKRAIRPFDGRACPTGRWLTPREIARAWEIDPLVRRMKQEASTPTAAIIDGGEKR